MSLTLSRRSFLAGSTFSPQEPQGCPSARAQGKPVRIGLLTVKTGPLAAGRHPDGAGHAPLPQGPEQHAGRPQGRARRRRHRRQPGGRQDQDPGAGRARQRRHDLRAARRLRAPRHHRLRRAGQDADPEPRRRRGHDAAQAQSLLRPRLRHLGPEHARAGRLRREGAEVQERDHDRGRLRLRPRADGRLPARLRGRGRPGREEAVAADRDPRLHALPRADQRGGRGRPGLRRLEPAQVHEAVPGPGAEAAGAGRRAGRATTRCSRASATRRSA